MEIKADQKRLDAKDHDVDQDNQGQKFSEPSRTFREKAEKITLSSVKANTVGENEKLLKDYQDNLRTQKDEIVSQKKYSKKRSAKEVSVDEEIS